MQRVVLITIDTFRADQPWSGYSQAKTPALSKLADASLVFRRAWSLANTTGPSLGAMLASRYPTELKRDDCPLAGMDVEDGLAQRLSAGGVWTAAAHGHAYFATAVAPRQGFDQWRTVPNVLGRRASDGAITGHEVTDIALSLLQEAPADRPSFVWAHYVDPHHKYVLHPGFPPSNNPGRSLYDGEVAFTDHQVGRLLEAIDASPLASRTAVLLTADHGEAFGEHERWRHGTSVFDEELRVPLMVRAPGLTPRHLEVPRSTLDVAPTIAALLGVDAPPGWRGRSLLGDAGPGEPEARDVVVDCPALLNAPARRAAVLGTHKVIESDGRWVVYDLQADPLERSALSKEQAAPLIERARQLFAGIESVPSRPCARQAFRVRD
jgi:arylsulfatase A-like enzyme